MYIDEKNITLQGKRILTQSMSLEDVTYIVFDEGTITKYGGGSPCSITLFDASYSKSLIINNPSFLLICNLQKRLKHATFKFNNYKFYIIFGCGFIAFVILKAGNSLSFKNDDVVTLHTLFLQWYVSENGCVMQTVVVLIAKNKYRIIPSFWVILSLFLLS